LVKDGPFYTSAGLTAGIDLSLALIEEDYGRHVALATAQELMTPVANWNGEKELLKPLVFDSQPKVSMRWMSLGVALAHSVMPVVKSLLAKSLR
jgi:transcriptional regulator GlxA family with amidase domain